MTEQEKPIRLFGDNGLDYIAKITYQHLLINDDFMLGGSIKRKLSQTRLHFPDFRLSEEQNEDVLQRVFVLFFPDHETFYG